MEGLEHNVALEELYLSHNAIEQLEGFAHLVRIQVLAYYIVLECCMFRFV